MSATTTHCMECGVRVPWHSVACSMTTNQPRPPTWQTHDEQPKPKSPYVPLRTDDVIALNKKLDVALETLREKMREADALREKLAQRDEIIAMIRTLHVPNDALAGGVEIGWRGYGAWCVYRRGHVLRISGGWEYEPLPSNRTEDFIARTRFDTLEAAIEAARKAVE